MSGILFAIGVEIFAHAVNNSYRIKGIEIDPEHIIKITQYADDTTVFVKDVNSLNELLGIL